MSKAVSGTYNKKVAFLDAASNGDINTVRKFLKDVTFSTEVNLQIQGKKGLTALLLAAWNGHAQVVKLLLVKRANKNAEANGLKAVHFAAKGGHVEVLQVLWDTGCQIKCLTAKGSSPLHIAANEGHLEAVKWLVEKGVNIHQKGREGLTPLEFAKKSEHGEVVKYLQEKNEELKMNDLTERRKLGDGAFGEVFLVKRDGRDLALKSINLSGMSRRVQEYAHHEIKVLRSLKHPYIVSYVGGGFKGNFLYIQMEYCSGGTLSGLISEKRKKHKLFDECQIVNWSLRLCLALKYIHGRNILHRDIKPDNIFITGEGIIKLGDLGLAKSMEDGFQALTYVGTPAYMSPELHQGTPYNAAADMWSLGCVMFEMAVLRRAFPYTNLNLPVASEDYQEMVLSLLENDPGSRPSVAELLAHPYFHRILEEQLPEKEHQISSLHQEMDVIMNKLDYYMAENEKHEAEIIILKREAAV